MSLYNQESLKTHITSQIEWSTSTVAIKENTYINKSISGLVQQAAKGFCRGRVTTSG